jgi:hypothetical protein
MATSTEVTMTVALPELRKALTSVIVHAEPTKTGDEINHLSRVRLAAAKDELHVVATNSTTSALAAVAIEEDSRKERIASDDGSFEVDLAPGPLRNILQAFKVSADSASAESQWCELVFSLDFVTITDTSALFPGLSLRIPVMPRSDQFPPVRDVLKQALAGVGTTQVAKPLVGNGVALALFRRAAQAYNRQVEFLGTGTEDSRGFVVLVGSQFIGAVSSRHNDDNSLAARDAERHKHLVRLGLAEPRVLVEA